MSGWRSVQVCGVWNCSENRLRGLAVGSGCGVWPRSLAPEETGGWGLFPAVFKEARLGLAKSWCFVSSCAPGSSLPSPLLLDGIAPVPLLYSCLICQG